MKVWEWKNNDAFGNNAPDENPGNVNAATFQYNLHHAGQYFGRKHGGRPCLLRDGRGGCKGVQRRLPKFLPQPVKINTLRQRKFLGTLPSIQRDTLGHAQAEITQRATLTGAMSLYNSSLELDMDLPARTCPPTFVSFAALFSPKINTFFLM